MGAAGDESGWQERWPRQSRRVLGRGLDESGLVGLYVAAGRPRTERDPVERARTTVTRRIRTALKAIAEVSPDLAWHLDRSVRTGRMCAYLPEQSVRWQL